MNRSYSKIRHIKESNQILESRKLDEQLLSTLKKYVDKGVNMVMGKTGNKYWDAANDAKVGRMEDGDTPNVKRFCQDGCEVSVLIYSDGRAVLDLAEFDKKIPGKMVFNSDGSFIFKWNDGDVSQKYRPN